MSTSEIKLSKDEWDVREVTTVIDGYCGVHNYGSAQYQIKICRICEKERAKQEGRYCNTHHEITKEGICTDCVKSKLRKTPEGLPHDGPDKFGRSDGKKNKITQFAPEEALAFIEARKRKSTRILEEAEASVALTVTWRVLNRWPDSNLRNGSMGSSNYGYRLVSWGVNLETGVRASNALVNIGILDFRITSDRWLGFRIVQELQVKDLIKRG